MDLFRLGLPYFVTFNTSIFRLFLSAWSVFSFSSFVRKLYVKSVNRRSSAQKYKNYLVTQNNFTRIHIGTKMGRFNAWSQCYRTRSFYDSDLFLVRSRKFGCGCRWYTFVFCFFPLRYLHVLHKSKHQSGKAPTGIVVSAPNLNLVPRFISSAITIAVINYVLATSIAKSMASKSEAAQFDSATALHVLLYKKSFSIRSRGQNTHTHNTQNTQNTQKNTSLRFQSRSPSAPRSPSSKISKLDPKRQKKKISKKSFQTSRLTGQKHTEKRRDSRGIEEVIISWLHL